jgi:two-component system response regulator YesN
MIGDVVLSYYKAHTRCYVSVGSPVKGIQDAWLSYREAKRSLAYARFYEPNTVLIDNLGDHDLFHAEPALVPALSEDDRANERISSLPALYRTALEDRNEQEARKLLEEFRGIWYHSSCSDNTVKSAYYAMLLILNQMYHTMHISSDVTLDHPGLVVDAIDSAFSFLEIDELIHEKTDDFFSRLSNRKEEDPTIYRIKEYINLNYKDKNLSVKSISESVFLSVSYLCTYFKNETGITLNQYITDFRIKKAMTLLADTNMKIVDVSNAVGYRDSNYFAKIFKKQTGLSPKEYKNKAL